MIGSLSLAIGTLLATVSKRFLSDQESGGHPMSCTDRLLSVSFRCVMFFHCSYFAAADDSLETQRQAIAAAAKVIGEGFDVDTQFLVDHLEYERVPPSTVCMSWGARRIIQSTDTVSPDTMGKFFHPVYSLLYATHLWTHSSFSLMRCCERPLSNRQSGGHAMSFKYQFLSDDGEFRASFYYNEHIFPCLVPSHSDDTGAEAKAVLLLLRHQRQPARDSEARGPGHA
jgi:hypothetical protein